MLENKKCIFYHLEKCGGTTILESSRAILGKENVLDIAELISPLSEVHPSEQLRLNKDLIHDKLRNFNFVHDPYGFLLPDEFYDYTKIVILRNPADRYISYLNMVVNYNSHDVKVAPKRALDEYSSLINLEDDDLEGAQNCLQIKYIREFFKNCHTNYELNINSFDHIFFLEEMYEFELWFLEWCNSSRKKLLTFNKGNEKNPKRFEGLNKHDVTHKLKKFKSSYKVKIPFEIKNIYFHGLMINRSSNFNKALNTNIKQPLMDDLDMGKYGDVYAKEDNPYGLAHWLAPNEIVFIPCSQNDLKKLFYFDRFILQFKIANMAGPNVLEDLEGYILERNPLKRNDKSCKCIQLIYEFNTEKTPFTISFKVKDDYLQSIKPNKNLFLFLKHKPLELGDGRQSSVQLSGGELKKIN